MPRRHLRGLRDDEFCSDKFGRSGAIGLTVWSNDVELKRRTRIMKQVKTLNELINRTRRAKAPALVLTLFVFLLGTTTARSQGHGR